jgi:hypothetical protein
MQTSLERPLLRSRVLDAIVAAMTPLVGETMARSSANLHLRSITTESVDAGELEAALGRIGSALNVFVGRDRALTVIAAIRKTLEMGASV